MCEMLGANKTRTAPYHPQSDGLVERGNGTLKDMLAKFINSSQNDWDVHASTRVTPYRMLYGREARIPVDLLVEGISRI